MRRTKLANYRKAYLCICDGQQEIMYLNHVAKLIKDFPRKVVKFNTFEDLPHRLEKRYENYDSAAVFDFDYNEVEFKRNIEICDRLNKKLSPSKRISKYYKNNIQQKRKKKYLTKSELKVFI